MAYNGRISSPGPSWAALDERTTPSTTIDDEDEDEDELEEDQLESQNNGYRSSTPLKRKTGRIEQGRAKRPRHMPPPSFKESSTAGSKSTGNVSARATATSTSGWNGSSLFRARLENLSMDDPSSPQIPSSTQPVARSSTTTSSTPFASQQTGQETSKQEDGGLDVRKKGRKRHSPPTDLRNGKHTASELSSLLWRKKHSDATPSNSKGALSFGKKAVIGIGSEDGASGSRTTKTSSRPSSTIGLKSNAPLPSVSLGKKKSVDRMDVDEDDRPHILSQGRKKVSKEFNEKAATLDLGPFKGSKFKSNKLPSSKPSSSASAGPRLGNPKAAPSPRRYTHHGPPSKIQIPEKGRKVVSSAIPRSSQPPEIITITDDDEPALVLSTQPNKKDKAKGEIPLDREVVEILDSDEERESLRRSLGVYEPRVENKSRTNVAPQPQAKNEPISVSQATKPKDKDADKRRRHSTPNIGAVKSREPEVIVISDSEDEVMETPSPIAPAESPASGPFDDSVLSPVVEPSSANSVNLLASFPSVVDSGENQEKEAELSQGVDALSLADDPMPVDDFEQSGFPSPPLESPPLPEVGLEPAAPMREQSIPRQLDSRISPKDELQGKDSSTLSGPLDLHTHNPQVSSPGAARKSVSLRAITPTPVLPRPTTPLLLSSSGSSNKLQNGSPRKITNPTSDSVVTLGDRPSPHNNTVESANNAVGETLACPADPNPNPPVNNATSDHAMDTRMELQQDPKPSEPLFLPSSSSSSSPDEPPPPRRRLQLARKSTGGKMMKRQNTDSNTQESRATTDLKDVRYRDVLTSFLSEPFLPSSASGVPKGRSTSGSLRPTSQPVSTASDTLSASTSRAKDKPRHILGTYPAERQSIADAINLASASNAPRKPRKSRVTSGSGIPDTVMTQPQRTSKDSRIGLTAGRDLTTAFNTIPADIPNTAKNTVANLQQSAPEIPAEVFRTSQALQKLIQKKKAEREVLAGKVTETSRSSTDELNLRPPNGLPSDKIPQAHENDDDREVTLPERILHPIDKLEKSVSDEGDSAECEALLEYTDDDLRVENILTADSSGAESGVHLDDEDQSDDPLARPFRDTSPSSGGDDDLSLFEGPPPTFPPTPPSPSPAGGAPVVKTYGGIPALVWKDYRKNPANFYRKVYWARDLPHALQDQINAFSELIRRSPQMRDVFLATVRENTVEDEPDAPDIIVENEVDDEPAPPWEFHYSNQMWHADDVPPPDIESLVSCDCVGKCDPRSKTCACVRRQTEYFHEDDPQDFVYDSRGRLKKPGYPMFECNDRCGCDDDCRNRVVQHGRKVAVKIAKTLNKGWGVFCGPKKIPKGTFLGIYSGELITDAAGEQRGIQYNKFGRTYLFDLDFHHLKTNDPDWDVRYTVDAYHAGNFTRFLNHSCDPNARLFPCYINESNLDKPLLAVFSIHDIDPNEEICFSYSGNYPDDGYDSDEEEAESDKLLNEAIYVPCLCGTARCTGKMFK